MKFEGEEGTQDWELEQQRLNQLPKSFKLRGFDSTMPSAGLVTAKNLPKLALPPPPQPPYNRFTN